ncbi:MAG: M23 family metallopeptidase [Rhodospirillaceae bacterium]|jgi:murein DD-endopeptidase MepM/ murein hydrolase activator NlpD
MAPASIFSTFHKKTGPMLLRGLLAAGVLIACIIVSARVVLEFPEEGTREILNGQSKPIHFSAATLAKAPISLGNPAAAASLRIHLRQLPRTEIVPDTPYRYTLRIRRGETLSGLLIRTGFSRDKTQAAIKALKVHYNPRHIEKGQRIKLTFLPQAAGQTVGSLLGIELAPDFDRDIIVRRNESGEFDATVEKKQLQTELALKTGVIRHSLFVAGKKSGVPNRVLAELIRAYSWDIDFQRDIHPGDSFEVLYEHYTDEDGNRVRAGNIKYAVLKSNRRTLKIYRYTTKDGTTDYFDVNGKSARKALMRTPIDGARLSSGFGRRRHPILGYTKMHRGVDFAAPRGTPIYAAGDGVIRKIGWNGGYGRYIRIRHNRTHSTAYAHLHRFARGLKRGNRVRQGQVIGYVGTTGRSTGPHLHYEILRAGRQVNPLRVRMPSGRQLQKAELDRFNTAKTFIDRQIATLRLKSKLASNTR